MQRGLQLVIDGLGWLVITVVGVVWGVFVWLMDGIVGLFRRE